MFGQLEALERQADREVAFRDQFNEHPNTLSRVNERARPTS